MADDGGLAKFQARMRGMPERVRLGVIPVLAKQAEIMADTMEILAPEDTGDLKGSIAVTLPGGATPPYSQPGGAKVLGPLEAAVTVGNADVRYPHLVEYGTTKNEAHPFFWPSVRLNRAKAASAIKRAISKAVRGKK
ncbi:HK97 gp10 family phage protein [Cereibacter changlensis]|uniref:HK97 gp10 family phage protein n=1 Tax=Cereibacter changlensis TaxID=402884 RepID=A0A4U0Z7L9_9RHOB|nr:HK97-gp10 family putative phage morphogenesis protein [Cereibacter changlensis]TKA98544.1 HK97 gp10 family phage protein [Cereibacter changlensis]